MATFMTAALPEEVAAAAPPELVVAAPAEPEPEEVAEVEAVSDASELALLDREVVAEADELLEEDRPEEAFWLPQTMERQAVMPSRSFGWALTQSSMYCAQTKEGMVWS